jgi:hypothetical protein
VIDPDPYRDLCLTVCAASVGGESVTTPADGEAKVPADTTVWFTTA